MRIIRKSRNVSGLAGRHRAICWQSSSLYADSSCLDPNISKYFEKCLVTDCDVLAGCLEDLRTELQQTMQQQTESLDLAR